MGKSSRNKKRAMENLNFFYQDIVTSSSTGGHLTQEEAAKEAIAIMMRRKFALLEEERPIIETMAYHDKYKKILNEVWKDKVKLDRKIVKEEEEVKWIKGEALKEKDDPGAFIFPIRLEGQVNNNALVDTGSNINTMPYWIYEQLGREEMKKVRVTTSIAKFLILVIPIERDSPIVVGRGFLRTIGGIVNTPERLFSTFDGFCHQTFHAARSDVMRNAESDSHDEEEYQIKRNYPESTPVLSQNRRTLPIFQNTMGTHEDEAGSSQSKRSRQHETVEEVLLPQAHHEILLWEGCNRDAKSRDLLNIMGCDGEIDDMLRIRLPEAGSDEEIFTSVAWIRAFNINEPIYADLCHELGLYKAVELEEEGFNVYFEGGLRSHEHFNAQDYWLSISREENLGLSRSHTSTIKKPILRVIHKMITYGLCQRTTGYDNIQKNNLWLLSMFDAKHQNGYANMAWLIARWMKRKGAHTQKESQICYRQIISNISRKCRVLTDDVVRNLSALIYYRDLDTTTLRDLINSEGKLILEDPQSGVPRVGIPRPPRIYA
ncbi:hypothetical protein Tco_0091784 [Tanacetum coccineum]